ncbi:MAG TPA: ParB/RepB/Spo0J family partition protein [Abditibacteriaceae bacterium]|jgi:ParB family chromosome partitioning protein
MKKGLGRGLAALIPETDMDFLRQVARGDDLDLAPTPVRRTNGRTNAVSRSNMKTEDAGVYAPETVRAAAADAVTAEAGNGSETAHANVKNGPNFVDIAAIEANPYQPRRHFNEQELADLAASIEEHGVLQPVLLRETAEAGRYQLIAGERRWRASQRAGLTQIPAIVRIVDDRQALELALIENVQRHDISAIDTAMAYRRLAKEFELSQEEIAQRVGKSRSAVANTLRLLDLHEEARIAIENGSLSEGHGRAILSAPTEGSRRALFRRVVRDQLSVRETERLASRAKQTTGSRSDENSSSDSQLDGLGEGSMQPFTEAELQDFAVKLEKRLGTRLSFRPKGAGGTLVVQYSSPSELQRIFELIAKT